MKQAELKKILEEYNDRLPDYKRLRDKGERALKKSINRSGIKYHSISNRIKEFDSFAGKVRKKNTGKPFEDIKDIVGLRTVCLFLSDLDRVEKVIDETFEVVEREDKTNTSREDVFGYMGKHFIVKLKAEGENNAMPFEIQVRTIAQDAWASVSHHLDYKKNSTKGELKRDFHALSGLFYVADTHFSFIQNNSREVR